MSLLTPNAAVEKTSAKEAFVKSGPRTITPPRRKAFNLADERTNESKLLAFGPVGSGKTQIALGPLLLGFKILYITTDVGDSGHITLVNGLRRIGRLDLLSNVLVVPLSGWAEVRDFFAKPLTHVPQLEAFKSNFAYWDGFSGFQQIDVSEYVGSMTPAGSDSRMLSDGREAGLQFEQTDWGMVKNATVRAAEWFFSMKNPDGRPLHKIMTCHELAKAKTKTKPNEPTVYEESFTPLLQGAGGQLMLGAFDLIIRTKMKIKKGDDGEKRVFTYVTAGHENTVAKNRGFSVEPEMPADPVRLYNIILQDLGERAPVELESYPNT